MKTRKLILLVLVGFTLILNSCRTEDEEVINPVIEDRLTSNSEAANLIGRTALRDGSEDNIIDKANCLSVQLPVNVTVNGIELIVNDEDGYEEIEDIFDLFDNDIDSITISFPITVILSDYSTIEVNSNAELVTLAVNCEGENEDDDDIECIDFQYPITVAVFNEDNEQTNTISIDNDNEMYDFIEDLDEFAAVIINFPITVVFPDGTTMTIDSIQELENVIEDADDSCDEDDDNDFDDDDCDSCTTNDLDTVFADCMQWTLDKLERNNNDLENLYNGYTFSFGNDGSVTVTENSNTIMGSWQASGSGNNISVIINIPGLPDFNDTWNLHEIEIKPGEAEVDLRKGDDRLGFESNCDTIGGEDTLSTTLTAANSIWFVSSYIDDGVNETGDFSGYEFTFETSGTVIASNGGNTTGSWASQNNATKLVLNFGTTEPLTELNDDWDVVSISESQVELQDVSGGGGGADTLTLTKK